MAVRPGVVAVAEEKTNEWREIRALSSRNRMRNRRHCDREASVRKVVVGVAVCTTLLFLALVRIFPRDPSGIQRLRLRLRLTAVRRSIRCTVRRRRSARMAPAMATALSAGKARAEALGPLLVLGGRCAERAAERTHGRRRELRYGPKRRAGEAVDLASRWLRERGGKTSCWRREALYAITPRPPRQASMSSGAPVRRRCASADHRTAARRLAHRHRPGRRKRIRAVACSSRVLLSRRAALSLLANGRCVAARRPRLAFNFARVSRAWCDDSLGEKQRPRGRPGALYIIRGGRRSWTTGRSQRHLRG